ncbi:MAG: GEVED domain-containing protein [Leptolyngbyaceae cyanobacterium MO_188.B28]|nr:GEVED domain-containing protein [Leptolyngbyaceae cyanobacterium MO_188.B28]
MTLAPKASAQLSLYQQFIGNYDHVVTGGTLRTQSDSVNACAVTNTSTSTLSGIPPTATVTAAYLYWAGSQGPSPDYNVTFEGQSISADRTFTDTFFLSGFPTFEWFQGFADVTSAVASKGNGTYTFSDLTVDTGTTNPSMCSVSGVLSGWSLLVVYEDSTTVTRVNALNIYDGFSVSRNSSQNFTLSGIQTSQLPIAKFTSLIWEGDLSLGGSNEFFSFEGNVLSDAFNSATNPFNSSINSLGLGADTTYGVDLDTFDVSSLVTSGATSVTGQVSSNNDLVILGMATVAVSIVNADLEVIKAVDNPNPNVGENITYQITVENKGDDNATGVVISDVLPSQVSYVSHTGTGTYNPSTGDWTVGNLNVGNSETLEITVSVDSVGTFSNTASVKTADQTDPDSTPGNNDPNEDDQDSVSVTSIAPPSLDYGDAPDTYGTDAANDSGEGIGANHIIVSGLHLGLTAPDSETDAASPLDGSSDGLDEDGINLSTLTEGDTTYTIPATDITVTNTTGGSATLHAWIDFDGSGAFEIDEYTSQTVSNAMSNGNPDGALSWTGSGVSGLTGGTTTYARFRLTTDGGIDGTTPAGAAVDGEVEDYQVTIAQASSPNVLLVKRITLLNGDFATTNGDDLAAYIDEAANAYDDNTITIPADPVDPEDPSKDTDLWPDPATFLVGGINGGDVRPDDKIEYTIYFLSSGGSTANSVLVCDRVPDFVDFIPNIFNVNPTADPSGNPAGDRGIVVGLGMGGGAISQSALTNETDGDIGYYFPPGVDPTATFPNIYCGGTNNNGAVVVNLGDLPNATSSGDPAGSYGFVRFRARVR